MTIDERIEAMLPILIEAHDADDRECDARRGDAREQQASRAQTRFVLPPLVRLMIGVGTERQD